MGFKKNKKINRELIPEISTDIFKYYIVFDNMYKASECELEYIEIKDKKYVNFEQYKIIHDFFCKSGAPVMQLNRVKNNSFYFRLNGNYKTSFVQLNNGEISSEKLYNSYMSVINSIWFYTSNENLPDGLRNYKDFAKQEVLYNFIKIVEFISDKKISNDNIKNFEIEIDNLFEVINKMPQRVVHGDLTLKNVLIYHDDFMLINYQKGFVGPFLYDLVVLVTDMCHNFGDDFEMVFLKDFYETSYHFMKDEIKEEDFFISYKAIQFFALINDTIENINNELVDENFKKYELKVEVSNMKKYTVKYSEFQKFWKIYDELIKK